MKNWLDRKLIALKCKWNAMKTEETGNEIVTAVIIIGIVVLLALVFKDNLSNIVTNIFDNANEQLETVMAPID